MKPMRRNRLEIPLKKVRLVLPRPFSTLVSVVFKYRNGQIHAKIVIKLPASELEKTNSPRNFPKIKKKAMQLQPNRMQNKNVFLIVFLNVVVCPEAFDSETEGSNIKESEPVRAFGNNIKGRAIPVKIP